MTTRLLTNPVFLEHLVPAGHPERPDRLRAIEKALGDEAFAKLDRREAQSADESAVILAHPESHLAFVKRRIPQEGLARLDAAASVSPTSFEAAMT
nr:histone deacetylase family protein [Rhizobiaceae bacterium]